jgi:hypothetical protein
MEDKQPLAYSIKSGAESLGGLCTKEFRRLLAEHQIPVFRIGRRLMVHPDDAEALRDKLYSATKGIIPPTERAA